MMMTMRVRMMTMVMKRSHLPKTLPSLITSYSPSAETYKWDPSSPDHQYHDHVDNHDYFDQFRKENVLRIHDI